MFLWVQQIKKWSWISQDDFGPAGFSSSKKLMNILWKFLIWYTSTVYIREMADELNFNFFTALSIYLKIWMCIECLQNSLNNCQMSRVNWSEVSQEQIYLAKTDKFVKWGYLFFKWNLMQTFFPFVGVFCDISHLQRMRNTSSITRVLTLY